MLTLALLTWLAAPPSPRVAYEQKCLYCHSEEVAESRRFTPGEWPRVVERMRLKAPLLITRSDVPVLTRYLVRTLRLVPSRPAAPVKPATGPVISPPPLIEPPPLEPEPAPEPIVNASIDGGVPLPTSADDQRGFALLERRCSRCHTLGRVFGKLDSLERTLAVLERMRVKTGSGITDRDQQVLEQFVRAQFQNQETH